MVKHAVVAEAVNRCGFALYVHGAMLRYGDAAMLLPAAPGSGKTCLSLALAASGLNWHTDEMILLEGEGLRARGVPACPCIKEPAWALIERFSRELYGRRVHRRADGQTVRYPPPPCDPGDPALSLHWPVRWLVFPRHTPGGGVRLMELGRVAAVSRLMAETPAMRADLQPAFVRKMVDWIGAIECYALEFDGLEDAAAELCRMVGAAMPRADGRRALRPALA